MKKRLLILMAVTIALLFKVSDCLAIYGHITSDTTWSDTVFVTGDIVVDSIAMLTINPGTYIKFFANGSEWDAYYGINGRCDIVIHGGMKVLGTVVDSVTLTSSSDTVGGNPSVDNWGRIMFVYSVLDTGCIIQYAKISYAHRHSCAITSNSDIIVTNCHITHNGYGVDAVGSSIISNNLITENIRTGVEIGGNAVVKNNIIVGNGYAGVGGYSGVIGGSLEDANDIYNNGTYNVIGRVIATHNYWGTLDEEEIISHLGGGVIYTPWTNSSHDSLYYTQRFYGVIAADTLWTDTVKIIGDIVVPQGITLTIDSGTVVEFRANYSIWDTTGGYSRRCDIIVYGALTSVGTETDSIVFTNSGDTPSNDDWGHIKFEDTSVDTACMITYSQVKHASCGVWCDHSSPLISHNLVYGCREGVTCLNSSPDIKENLISGVPYELTIGISCSGSSSPYIFQNTITRCHGLSYGGICCGDSSSPYIFQNTITYNKNGIECSGNSSPNIDDNIIESNNNTGICCGNTPSSVTRNTIISNGTGISCSGSSPVIGGNLSLANDIYDNSSYNLSNDGPVVNATYNYWGTTDENSIRYTLTGDILYSPWTNANHDTLYYAQYSWETERVWYGYNGASLALDSFEQPYIAFIEPLDISSLLEGKVVCAHKVGSDWQFEIMNETRQKHNYYPSIALDTFDLPHICWVDHSEALLRYAYYDGSSWNSDTIDEMVGYAGACHMAIGSTNNPHVSYYRVSDTLKYATKHDGVWQKQALDSGRDAGMWNSISLDSYGNPHIVYYVEYQPPRLRYCF